MTDKLYELFGEERVKYFQTSDRARMELGDTFITYRRESNWVILSVGSNEGEAPVALCKDPEHLERVFNVIVRG